MLHDADDITLAILLCIFSLYISLSLLGELGYTPETSVMGNVYIDTAYLPASSFILFHSRVHSISVSSFMALILDF